MLLVIPRLCLARQLLFAQIRQIHLILSVNQISLNRSRIQLCRSLLSPFLLARHRIQSDTLLLELSPVCGTNGPTINEELAKMTKYGVWEEVGSLDEFPDRQVGPHPKMRKEEV